MDYVSIDVLKRQIEVMYSDINKLRIQMDQMKRGKDKKALSRLVVIGAKVKKGVGGISTKELMDDVRG